MQKGVHICESNSTEKYLVTVHAFNATPTRLEIAPYLKKKTVKVCDGVEMWLQVTVKKIRYILGGPMGF